MQQLTAIIKTVMRAPGIYFFHEPIDDLCTVDLGYELAVELSQVELHSPSLPMIANDCICELLDRSIQTLGDGRTYLGITNTNILFEPQLALNVEAILRSYARSLPVAFYTTGWVKNNQYLPFFDRVDISVDLTNIKHTEITK